MQDTLLANEFAEAHTTPDFYLALVFDHKVNGCRGMQVCSHLIDTFGQEFLFHVAACHIQSFEQPMQPSPALTFAGKARLLFLAIDGPLPESLRAWLGAWAFAAGEQPVALAALAGRSDPAGAALLRDLRPLCSAFHIDLLCLTEEAQTLTARQQFSYETSEPEKCAQSRGRMEPVASF